MLQYAAELIGLYGHDTKHQVSRELAVPGSLNYYVDGRRITHLNTEKLLASGYEYSYNSLDLAELADLLENLESQYQTQIA